MNLLNCSLKKIDMKLRTAFAKIREEFDEHREAINQNTNELQYNYEFLCKLDSKIEKLNERIDELSMFIHTLNPPISGNAEGEKHDFDVSKLTSREKEVFLVLYAIDDELTYREIAQRTALAENLVICYVTNLIAKGVPVNKRYVNSEVRLHLDQGFKALQAKMNIVGLSEMEVRNVRI